MLTDKQIEDIALKYTRVCGGHWEHEDAIPDRDVLDFARAIEKAVLLEGNYSEVMRKLEDRYKKALDEIAESHSDEDVEVDGTMGFSVTCGCEFCEEWRDNKDDQ